MPFTAAELEEMRRADEEIEREFRLLDLIEKLTPELMRTVRGSDKVVCANVDMYSGLIYQMRRLAPPWRGPFREPMAAEMAE